jgi:hypothetical protein
MPQGSTTPDASGVTVAGRGVGVWGRGLSGTTLRGTGRAAHYGGSCVWEGQQRIFCERATGLRPSQHMGILRWRTGRWAGWCRRLVASVATS